MGVCVFLFQDIIKQYIPDAVVIVYEFSHLLHPLCCYLDLFQILFFAENQEKTPRKPMENP